MVVAHATAHPMPMSGVLLDFAADHIDAELRLPTDRLEIGLGLPVSVPAPGAPYQHEAALREYLRMHITPHAPDGRAWKVELGRIGFIADTQPVLVAQVRLAPPIGAPVRQLAFDYDVIAHEIVTHTVVVAVRRDWAGGKTSSTPETLGIIRNQQKTVTIDRGDAGFWRGFAAMFTLGSRHIAEGTDHLLFLMTLLLAAPLFAQRGRWLRHLGFAATLRRAGLIVTAFAIGHSLTLLIGTLGWLHLPSQVVETAIALSVFLSALHAIRPIFPQHEAWIAGTFGLVHGLAFASALGELDLGHAQLAWSLAGFNLGIEAVQLAIIAIVAPLIAVLARSRFYATLRTISSLFFAAAALGWAAERALGTANPLAAPVDWLAQHALWLLASLMILSAAQALFGRRVRLPLPSLNSNL